jgi:hypothetical protein
MITRFSILAILSATLLMTACDSSSSGPSGGADTSTPPIPTASSRVSARPSEATSAGPSSSRLPAASGAIEPANFTTTIDNRWFPLTPGTTYTYEGTKDGKRAVETFAVTRTTKSIDRVTCVVVEDTVSFGGIPAEKIIGYYAQDRAGNVWYFGEETQDLDASGHVVGTGGSWRAGVDHAPPALLMEASPVAGHSFAHDATKNDYAVLSLAEKVKVPYGSYDNALVTKEWSPLEPDVETHKFYVPDVGAVRDVAVKGPTEEFVLVKVEHT